MTYKEEITKLIRASYDQGAKDAQQETLAALEQIVAAARADEREQCAQLCEQGLAIATSLSALDDMEMWGEKFAAAIRARSNT